MGYSVDFCGIKTLVEVVKIKAPYGVTNVPKSLYSLLIMAVETENIDARELSEDICLPVRQLPISCLPAPVNYMDSMFLYKVNESAESPFHHLYNNFKEYPLIVRSIKADKCTISRCGNDEAYVLDYGAIGYNLLTYMTGLWIVWSNDEWEDFFTVRKYEKSKMIPIIKKACNDNNIYTQDGLDLNVLSEYTSPQFTEKLCYPFRNYEPYMLQDWGKKWDI